MSWIQIFSMCETMPCSAQKSSISCISAMQPVREPASEWQPKINAPPWIVGGICGSPTRTIMPSRLSICR